jgi:hypothetical protein
MTKTVLWHRPTAPPPESVSLDDIRSAFVDVEKSTEPPVAAAPPPPGTDTITFGESGDSGPATTDVEPEDFLQRFKAASTFANEVNDDAERLLQVPMF